LLRSMTLPSETTEKSVRVPLFHLSG